MEVVLSAAANDLVRRCLSFLMSKYSDVTCSEEEKRVERLQQLLLRARMVVEEADRRYITNSGMLLQLKMLSRAMYHGYHALDTFKCNQLIKEGSKEVTTADSYASYLGTPLKRFRANGGTSTHKVDNCNLQDALLKLENVVSNMTEFVILLSGCESMMFRRPHDTYLYMDNFMFGRQIEKQQVINFLLQHNPLGSPAVLPIIGKHLVGKKTLVKNVCNDEKVRSYFSTVLHLNGDNFSRIDSERCTSQRTLVVVTFVSDVDDEEWKLFYQAVTCMSTETKVIILSRMKRLARYGTMEPIHLKRLQDEEYKYLFKTLAFGSAQAEDHPKLTLVAGEFIKLLAGSFIGAYPYAYILRRDLNLQSWISTLNLLKKAIKRNVSMYGERLYPFRHRYPLELTDFLPSPAAPLHIMPPRTETEVSQRKLPKIRLKDIIANPSLRPRGDFDLVTWESRIPPYTEFCNYVPSCVQQQPKTTLRRKRDAPIYL